MANVALFILVVLRQCCLTDEALLQDSGLSSQRCRPLHPSLAPRVSREGTKLCVAQAPCPTPARAQSDGAEALAEALRQKSNANIHAQCRCLPGLLVAQSWADPTVPGFTLHSSRLRGTAFQGFVSDSSIIPKTSSTCFPSVVSPCCTSTSSLPPCHCLWGNWQIQSCIQPFSSPVFHRLRC